AQRWVPSSEVGLLGARLGDAAGVRAAIRSSVQRDATIQRPELVALPRGCAEAVERASQRAEPGAERDAARRSPGLSGGLRGWPGSGPGGGEADWGKKPQHIERLNKGPWGAPGRTDVLQEDQGGPWLT
ncbi:unnamed protein product, partial [Prorocentrum cordatum]